MGFLKKLWERLNEPSNRKQARYLTRQAYIMLEQGNSTCPGTRMMKMDSQGRVRDIGNLIIAGNLLEQAIEADPTYAHAHSEYGYITLMDEDYERAEKHIKIAIQLQPNEAKFWNNLAHTYLKRGNLELALISVTVAETINPRYAAAYALKAEIMQKIGVPEQVIQDLVEKTKRIYEEAGLKLDETPLSSGKLESFLAHFTK